MTIKEIAKRANVSLGTVDRVIHNRGKVSKKTKEKILKILEDVDYRPNVYARGLVLNKSYTIAALVPDFEPGDYWEVPSRGINRAANDLGQFGIRISFFYFNQNDTESFISQTQEIIELRPDGVILAPVINFEAVKICTRLKKMEIPFSIIDSNIKDSGYISFIGQDAMQSGRLAAKLLSTSARGRKKFLILSIKNNENHNRTVQKRSEGFKDFLLHSKNLQDTKVVEIHVNQRESDWKKLLEEKLTDQNPDGVYVPSSKVHFVAEILLKRKLDIKLVGNDLIDNNLNFVAAGIIDYVIDQRPEMQGYLAVENLYRFLVTNQLVEKDCYLPLDVITKENYMYYKSQIKI